MGFLFLPLMVFAQPWQVNVTNIGRLDGRLERLVDAVQVTVTSTSPTPVDAHFLLEITGNNGISFTNSTVFRDYEIPVNPGFQVFTIRNIQNFYAGLDFEDLLLANVSQEIIDYVTLQRRLPVGKYQICITVFDALNPQTVLGTNCLGINSTPKDPPIIMNPYEINGLGVNVNFSDPPNLMVNWIHPGVFDQDYTLEVKKLSSLQQLKDFNQQQRPQVYFEALPDAIFPEQNITGLSYVVTQDNNPFFNEGDILAIRITAEAPLGEFNNEGKSNIVIAILDGQRLVSGGGKLDAIPLDPVFAKLVNLENLIVSDNQNYLTLNGFADVLFDFPGGNGPVVLKANVQNLDIQKGVPVVMGGSVIINPTNQNFLPHQVSDFVKLTAIQYEFGEGFTAEGKIKTRDGKEIQAEGAFQVFANGLVGEIEAVAGPDGFEVFDLDQGQLRLKRISATYPQGNIKGVFDFSLFPGMAPVEAEVDMESENFSVQINQPVYQYFDLVEGSAFGRILIKEVSGTITGNWKSKKITPNLSVPSDVLLQLANGNYCGMTLIVDVLEQGVAARGFIRNCPFPDGPIDLGFLGLSFYEFEIEQLKFPTNKSGWDFRIRLSGHLFSPQNPNWVLPEINGLVITPSGILFPSIKFDEGLLELLPVVNFQGFELKFKEFNLNNFTFPRFSWKGQDLGPWDLSFESDVRFPQNWTGPDCMVGSYLELTQGRLLPNAGGQMSVQANINWTFEPACTWRMGDQFEAGINSIDGLFTLIRKGAEFEPNADLSLDGYLVLGESFDCAPNPPPTAFKNLKWNFQDGLNGRVEQLQPTCNVKIGPFTGEVTDAALAFANKNGNQEVKLEAAARLNLGNGRNVAGSFVLNMLTGAFDQVQFQLTGPFDIAIPQEDPVLVFRLNSATLTDKGLQIDGRHSVVVGNDVIPATFDNLDFDWENLKIRSGRVILDKAFTLKGGIDPQTMALQIQATGINDTILQLNPGLMVQLAGTIILDSTGIAASGTAAAALQFEGYNLSGLTITYTPDFKLAFDPIAVVSGSASLYHNGQLIATWNAQGFFPNPAFFAGQLAIERIPLPSEEIAYLQIRSEDQYLVDLIQEPNGHLLVRTRPNQPLLLVLPALQGAAPQPPTIPVVLQDLRINPATGAFVSGAVIAAIPSGQWPGGPAPFPMSLKEISFTTKTTSAGALTALFFKGDLKPFETQAQASGEIVLGVQLDGRLSGAFKINQLNTLIPFDSPNGRVVLAADSIVGNASVPLQNPELGTYNIQVHGNLQVMGDNNAVALRTQAGFELNENGFQLLYANLNGALSGQTLVMGDVELALKGITAFELNYAANSGFDYTIGVDLELALRMNGADSLPQFPLRNIEIRKGGVIYIPAQNIHEGTVPGLQLPKVAFGGFRLEPLALRTQETTIFLFNFQVSQITALQPRVDFLVTFPGVPELQNITLSITDAGFVRGVFTGLLQPLDLRHDPIVLPLGPDGLAFQIEYLLGELKALPNDVQDFLVDLKGRFRLPNFFDAENPFCDTTTFALRLDRQGNIAGTLNGLKPCGKLTYGPILLGFGPSTLNFSRISGITTASLSGNAQAAIYRAQADSIRASGQLTINLMTGEISNGQITVVGPFDWAFPTPDSVLTFSIASATINSEGLSVTGGGSLRAGAANLPVLFNNVKFALRDNKLKTGSIQINAPFALDVYLGGNDVFVVRDSNVPFTADGQNGARLMMPANLTLTPGGVMVNGNSTAELYFAGNNFSNLKIEFVATQFVFQPKFGVATGRMDFISQEPNQQPQRVGYYDSAGFHVDQIPNFVPIPDTLGLPTKDIAYIVLRNANGELLLNTQIVQGGVLLNTQPNQPLPIVLQGIKPNNGPAPTVNVQFQNVKINSSFQVVEGTITATLANPYLMPDFPIEIKSIKFERDQIVGYRLTAAARLKLPGDLANMEVDIPRITITPTGLECVDIEVGQFSNDFVQQAQGQPLAQKSFNNGEFAIVLQGVMLSFCTQNGAAVQFSGQFSSNLFTPDANTPPAQLHVVAGYANSSWTAQVKTAHLQDQRVPFGLGEVRIDRVELEMSTNLLAITLDGAVRIPELLGETTISFQALRIATNGVSIGQASANLLPQNIEMFGQQDFLYITALTATYINRHLYLTMDGRANALERQFNFTGLKIGTDRTIALQNGRLNLLAPNQTFDILGEMLVLDTLMIAVDNNNAQLKLGAKMVLPDPVESHQNRVSIVVDKNGAVSAPVQLNVNPNVNVALGDFGNIRVTGVGVDIRNVFDPNPQNFVVYASAEVNAQVANAGNAKVEVGTPGSPANAGILYGWGAAQPTWQNIRVSGAFKFENEFFDFELKNSVPLVSDQGCVITGFHLELNASASLKLSGFEGSLAFSGMCISKNGIEQLGELEEASISAMGMSLTIGGFDYINTPSNVNLVRTKSDDPSNPEAETVSIAVNKLIRFGASNISMFGFSGGFDEILYYQGQDGSVYLNVDNVNIALQADLISLNASLEYYKMGNDFSIRVAGGAQIGTTGLAAAGYIRNMGGDFGFGIFVKVSASIPIVPGLVTMTSVGGGFFYNPEPADFNAVFTAMNYGTPVHPEGGRPWERDNIRFAAFLSTSVGLVGEAGTFAVSGQGLVMITDAFLALEVRGTVLNQGNKLGAGVYASLDWSETRLMAGGELTVLYDPVLTGNGRVDFVAQPDMWKFTASFDVKVINTFDINSNVLVYNDGFMVDLTVQQGFDIWILEIRSSFELAVWWQRSTENFGAYTEITFKASIFAGIASVEGTLKGALIKSGNNQLIYAGARVRASILGIPKSASVWASINNGKFSGGRGSNSEYDRLIAEARGQMQEMQAGIDELSNMPYVPVDLTIDVTTLRSAGYTLATMPRSSMTSRWNTILNNEDFSFNGYSRPAIYNNVRNLFTNTDRPEHTHFQISQHRSNYTARKNAISNELAELNQRIDAIAVAAIEYEEQSLELLDNIENMRTPIEIFKVNLNDGTTVIDSFYVDSATEQSNQDALNSLVAMVGELDKIYLTAIDSIQANIMRIDRAINEQIVASGTAFAVSNMSLSRATGLSNSRLQQLYGNGFDFTKPMGMLNFNPNIFGGSGFNGGGGFGGAGGFSGGTGMPGGVLGGGFGIQNGGFNAPINTGGFNGINSGGNLGLPASGMPGGMMFVPSGNGPSASLLYAAAPEVSIVLPGQSTYRKMSANDGAEILADYLTLADAYAASEIAFRWTFSSWGKSQEAAMRTLGRNNIRTAAQNVMLDYVRSGRPNWDPSRSKTFNNLLNDNSELLSSSQVNTVNNKVGSRVYQIVQLATGSNTEANNSKSAAITELNNRWNATPRLSRAYYNEFVDKAVEIFYDMPLQGFDSVEVANRQQALDNIPNMRASIVEVKNQQADFSNRMHNLYLTKAAMMTTLYGIYELYEEFKSQPDIPNPTEVTLERVQTARQNLGIQLQAPRVDSIRVLQDLQRNHTVLSVVWNGTHPSGVIAEQAYSIADQGFLSSEPTLSVGNRNWATRVIYRNKENNFAARPMEARIRVRGPSGNTISTRVTFTAKILDNPPISATPESVIVGRQNSVPSKPELTFPYYHTGLGTTGNGHWTKDKMKIVFRVRSVDATNDIAHFEVRMGTTPGAGDLMDWQQIPGQRVNSLDFPQESVPQNERIWNFNSGLTMRMLVPMLPIANGMWALGSNNSTQEIVIRNLMLKEDSVYYISVRAVNGIGATGPVMEAPVPVRFTDSVPSAPTPRNDSITMLANRSPNGSTFFGPVTASQKIATVREHTSLEPELTVRWNPVVFSKGGLRHYQVVVTPTENASVAFEEKERLVTTTNNSVSLKGKTTEFFGPRYVHIKALALNGLESEPLTYGPFLINDPTPPQTPIVRAAYRNGKPGFYLERPPVEPETRRTAFNNDYDFDLFYSVHRTVGLNGSEPTPLVVSDFNPDFATNLWHAASVGDLPFVQLNYTAQFVSFDAKNIPHNTRVNVHSGARNYQGKQSAWGRSGPLVIDKTPPVMPSLQASNNNGNFTFTISSIFDAESKIQKVEHRVVPASIDLSNTTYSWTVVNYQPHQGNSFQLSGSAMGNANLNAKLQVRITNGAGLQQTAEIVIPGNMIVGDRNTGVTGGVQVVTNPNIGFNPNIVNPPPPNGFGGMGPNPVFINP